MSLVDNRPLVVMATDSAMPSGVGMHMLTLAKAVGASLRVIVAFPPTEAGRLFLNRAAANGIATKPIGNVEAFSHWLGNMSPALLHVHAGIGWEGHRLASAGHATGIPVIRTEHLPYVVTNDDQKLEHRIGVGFVDRLVFVSQAVADTFRQAGFSGAGTAIVRNGVEATQPTKQADEIRQRLNVPDHAPLVLTVARFTPQKDYGALLKAARTVAGIIDGVRFVLVGDGPELAAMQVQAIASGLGKTVMFLGLRDDVPDLLAVASLFVLPSRFEGLPLALLEAMSLGLPIVATRIGGSSEAVGENYPWLVQPADHRALARAIIEALTDDDRRLQVGGTMRNRFKRYFRADRMGREMVALYRSVLSQRARAA